ncbi:GTF2I repeat domain containing 2 [Chelydra serpentina]|uniref:GTF2I repeat domain containing 2 n=1 Tax=Chelydra serpentina TaxID=8475 RepID=A0A8T1T834_CHESE|nr:GTF2I repeat domain containing 2 [Chelydra serpentina]
MDQKRKDVTELQDNEWLQDLAFMADITEYLNSLNTRMYGCKQVVTEYYDNICAFAIKLQLWEKQLSQCNLAHFPIQKSLCDTTGTQIKSQKGMWAKLMNCEKNFTNDSLTSETT